MRVLLVDGLEESNPIPTAAQAALKAGDHEVTRLGLTERGFDEYMSAAERRAYHEPDNLLTPETVESAELLRTHDAVLVCTRLVAGAISPTTKSWVERVFIPEVSFTFTRSGRVTGALKHIKRVGMIVDCPDGTDGAIHRRSSTRSVLRGIRLNGSKLCRTTYLPLGPDANAATDVREQLGRW